MHEPGNCPPPDHPVHPKRSKRPHRSRIGMFFRGYLMIVGALTTIAAFMLLLVKLFVEIERWVN